MSRMFSSLRATLLIPFVGVVILVAVSISLLSYQTGLRPSMNSQSSCCWIFPTG